MVALLVTIVWVPISVSTPASAKEVLRHTTAADGKRPGHHRRPGSQADRTREKDNSRGERRESGAIGILEIGDGYILEFGG